MYVEIEIVRSGWPELVPEGGPLVRISIKWFEFDFGMTNIILNTIVITKAVKGDHFSLVFALYVILINMFKYNLNGWKELLCRRIQNLFLFLKSQFNESAEQ